MREDVAVTVPGLGCRVGEVRVLLVAGRGGAGDEAVERLTGGVLAEADAGDQVWLRAEAVLVGDTQVVGVGHLFEGHVELAGFALQQLACRSRWRARAGAR